MNIDINSLFQQAIFCIQKNELSEAEKILKKIVKFNIEHPDVYLQLGNVLGMQKKFPEALNCHLKADKLAPNRIDVLMSLGTSYDEMKNSSEAFKVFEKASKLDKNNPLILLGLGKAHFSNGHFQSSIDVLVQALKFQAKDYRIWFNLGIAQDKLGLMDDALVSYENALTLNPKFPEGIVNRGNVLLKKRLFDKALDDYQYVISFAPDFFKAYIAKAKVLISLNRLSEAYDTCQKGLLISPKSPDIYFLLGQILNRYFRHEEAHKYYEEIVKLTPRDAQAHLNLANSFSNLSRYEEAYLEYKITFKLDSDLSGLMCLIVLTQLKLCNWENLNPNIDKLKAEISSKEISFDPFITLLTTNVESQYQAAKNWSSLTFVSSENSSKKKFKNGKIRIGYFSGDFMLHPVSNLSVGLFECHNREYFEVIGFSTKGAKPDDPMRYRLQKAFDSFIDLESTPHLERIDMIQSYDLDIAIDLGGHTKDSTIALLEYRVAPVQISYIGYPGTTGTSFIDYTIADPLLVPEESQQFYSEKIIYMPDTFQVNDSKREVPALKLTKEELGIPQDKFIFCCFNNSYKLNPAMFDVWMNILKRVPGSVLWLLGESLSSQNNLIKEAHLRGVKADSLIFATRCSYNEYLSRLQVADLFLDTIPFNAGTTASDALWVGLPVLTVLGDAYAGRMAGSLLNAVGLPELITHHLQDYENLAVEIASDPSKINALKQKLADQKLITPLFNTQLFTQNLEKAYLQIVQRARDGLPPDHIYVN